MRWIPISVSQQIITEDDLQEARAKGQYRVTRIGREWIAVCWASSQQSTFVLCLPESTSLGFGVAWYVAMLVVKASFDQFFLFYIRFST